MMMFLGAASVLLPQELVAPHHHLQPSLPQRGVQFGQFLQERFGLWRALTSLAHAKGLKGELLVADVVLAVAHPGFVRG